MNLLPTRLTFHPPLQQNKLVVCHVQCFRNSPKLLPVFDQSVSGHVGFDLSKMYSLSKYLCDCYLGILKWMVEIFFPVEWSTGVEYSWNGSIFSAMLKACEPDWPGQTRISHQWGSSVRGTVWGPRGISYTGDGVVCYFKACKFYIIFCKAEFFWVQDYAISSTYAKPIFCFEKNSLWWYLPIVRISSMHLVLDGNVGAISSYILEDPTTEAM